MSTDQLVSGWSKEAAKRCEDRKQHRWVSQQGEFINLIQPMVVTVPRERLGIAKVLVHHYLRREV